ncbi:MAG: hypothetical protein RLP14_10305 [Owenweeksia sp.]
MTAFLIWMFATTVWLTFVPPKKIPVIAEFFRTVLPKFPFSKIANALKRRNSKNKRKTRKE